MIELAWVPFKGQGSTQHWWAGSVTITTHTLRGGRSNAWNRIKKMEDYRVSWMKERIFAALGLREDKLFLELLSRDEQKASRDLVSCLDQKLDGYSPAILFYPSEHEVEEMVEVIEGI